MLYAKVVLGLPIEGPFDYIIPDNLLDKTGVGKRAWVNFAGKRRLGYIVGLARESRIKRLKNVIEIIDDSPVLDKKMLKLTKEVSEYYCSSWGEVIDASLPQAIRKGRRLPNIPDKPSEETVVFRKSEFTLVHSLDINEKWEIYLEKIKSALSNKKTVVILFPDKEALLNARERISGKIPTGIISLFRDEAGEFNEWLSAKSKDCQIVVGMRSAIFAPLQDLGLIIIDEEHSEVYKQEQAPHYHAREVAFMRADIEGADLLLGSHAPSLESMRLVEKGRLRYIFRNKALPFPEIKIIEYKGSYSSQRKSIPLSRYMIDAVSSTMQNKRKTLLFLNRRGFATYLFCQTCHEALRCPRCSVNLVYHYKENSLTCHYCGFKTGYPKICPRCNSGYIKFSGGGVEKMESELSRLFPQASIKVIDGNKDMKQEEADIFVATAAIIKKPNVNFDLVGVLGIDNAFSRFDFRASEKAFSILMGLFILAKDKLIIQTSYLGHHCFDALANGKPDIFYAHELRERKQLKFPPYEHNIFIKVRSKSEEKAKKSANALFDFLKERNNLDKLKFVSLNAAEHLKLRGNYYWQILLKTSKLKKATSFLKNNLKDFSHSGIIITVDVDPV